MTIIEQMISLGIPVIVEQSNEAKGEYSFSSLTDEQQKMVTWIFSGITVEKGQRIENRKNAAKSEAALVSELKTVTPAEAAAWIENNVTTLATAKTVLKIMVRMLIAMRNQVWPDLPES